MQPLKFRKATINLDSNESFWYRMAFLDIQEALISVDSTTVDSATLDLIFDSLSQRWEELFEEMQQSKAVAH